MKRVSPNKGVRMTAAQRAKISAAMKARWAVSRAAKAKKPINTSHALDESPKLNRNWHNASDYELLQEILKRENMHIAITHAFGLKKGIVE